MLLHAISIVLLALLTAIAYSGIKFYALVYKDKDTKKDVVVLKTLVVVVFIIVSVLTFI
jgi:hypothetical protein